MSKPVKTASGKWRIQIDLTIHGKRIRDSYTSDVKSNCILWEKEMLHKYKTQTRYDLTVREAVDKYIMVCGDLAPTTLSGYRKIKTNAFQELMDMSVDDLDDYIVQDAIAKECQRRPIGNSDPNRTISAKTVINEWGLLATALKVVCKKEFSVRLPKKTKKIKRYPSPQEIYPIIQGTNIEIPCLMAMCLSLRMSEARGCQYKHIHGHYLDIVQTKIPVDNVDVVRPSTKTYDSVRSVKIPDRLYDMIMAQPHTDNDFIVSMSAHALSNATKKLLRKNGYDLTYHSLRHIFASTGAMLGIEPLYLADFGGWSGTKILEGTYEELFDSEKKRYEKMMSKFWDKILQ